MNIIKSSAIFGLCSLMAASISSCKNSDNDFPDYEGGISAYFAYQYPVRTIVLGEDLEYPNPLDNDHKFQIFATHGGSYSPKNLTINVNVDPSLVNNLTFEDGSPVKAMPESYYTLGSTSFTHDHGFFYGTTVQLSDAFFADPDAIKNTYVVPLVMTEARGADRILSGTIIEGNEGASRTNSSAWSEQPKDFVLYCVKFVNKFHAKYLRHGVDKITENGVTTTNVRHNQYVERDEVVGVSTASLNSCIYPVSTTYQHDGTAETVTCNLLLTFNGDECTISSATDGFSASGSGKFVKDGEKKSYNNADHDAIYLNYNVDFGFKKYETIDTLTLQVRGIRGEWFNPIYNN